MKRVKISSKTEKTILKKPSLIGVNYEKIQNNINGEVAKISALWSGKVDKNIFW